MKRVSPNGRAAPADAGTVVLLCGDLSELGNGLDLTSIEQWLEEDDPTARVEIVADLCDRPKALRKAAEAGVSHIVLGLCASDRAGPEFQYQARQAGIDPLAVETVSLGGFCAMAHPRALATSKAKVLLAGAVARARAFTGSGPEHVKPHLGWSDQRVSRRALFTLPPISYQPVAAVRADRCASEAGCDLCVGACPRDALSIAGGRLAVDKGACDACGICVATCPRRAIDLAGASLPQIEAQLDALLTANSGAPVSKAILFSCRSSLPALERLRGASSSEAWLPVQVPCAGMIQPGWLLQSLARGAGTVGVLACQEQCAFGQGQAVEGRVEYCRRLLEGLGRSPDRVALFSPETLAEGLASMGDAEPTEAPPGRGVVSLREPKATWLAISELAAGRGSEIEVCISHPAGPLGIMEIDAAGCTTCEVCAHVCPTDAVTSRHEGDRVVLEFDPTVCNACGLCERSCPESVIQVRRETDLGTLHAGTQEVVADAVSKCERCGAPVAPGAMMRRVVEILGDETSAGMLSALRLCSTCRGMGVPTRA